MIHAPDNGIKAGQSEMVMEKGLVIYKIWIICPAIVVYRFAMHSGFGTIPPLLQLGCRTHCVPFV
jgi:hypothetical protein